MVSLKQLSVFTVASQLSKCSVSLAHLQGGLLDDASAHGLQHRMADAIDLYADMGRAIANLNQLHADAIEREARQEAKPVTHGRASEGGTDSAHPCSHRVPPARVQQQREEALKNGFEALSQEAGLQLSHMDDPHDAPHVTGPVYVGNSIVNRQVSP